MQAANPGDPALCLSVSQESQVAPGSATCGPFAENGTFVTKLELTLHYGAPSANVQVTYTYSKSEDDSSNLSEQVNPFGVDLTMAPSAWDMRHDVVASYNYELPLARLFGRTNVLTDGWSISGTTRFTSGFPVTLYNDTDSSLLGTFGNGVNNHLLDTPDYTPGCDLQINHGPAKGPAFNAACFSVPALGTLGNAPRRFFYGPGIENTDLSLLKDFALGGAKTLQLRFETFNVFNQPQFYGPGAVDGNISSNTFGQIVRAASPRLVQLGAKLSF